MSPNERATLPDEPQHPAKHPDAPDADSLEEAATPILFFDGVCGLCNSSVDWLLRRDLQGAMRYAPLQGETAARLLSPAETESLDSVVLRDQAGLHRRSRGVVRALMHLGGRYRLYSWLLWLVPAPLREFGYKSIAKVRYRLFGKHESCRMPTPAERGRLLP